MDGASNFLIGFHGAYEHNDTFNILLEFADGGTLEDLFDRSPRPEQPRERLDFWSRLFGGLFKALNLIHQIKGNHPDEKKLVKGYVSPYQMGNRRMMTIFGRWHQDVKPDNILIKTVPLKELHEGHYKLADLGLSHFHEFTEENYEARDAKGTRTYGMTKQLRMIMMQLIYVL